MYPKIFLCIFFLIVIEEISAIHHYFNNTFATVNSINDYKSNSNHFILKRKHAIDQKSLEDCLNQKKNLVKIGAGNRLGNIYLALSKENYVVPAGTCPSVGISGHIMGGVSIKQHLIHSFIHSFIHLFIHTHTYLLLLLLLLLFIIS